MGRIVEMEKHWITKAGGDDADYGHRQLIPFRADCTHFCAYHAEKWAWLIFVIQLSIST